MRMLTMNADHKAFAPVLISLFLFVLISSEIFADPQETDPTGADRDFSSGAAALLQGRDREAADLIIRAARQDRRCLLLLERENREALAEGKLCSELTPGPETMDGDPSAQALYYLAVIKKDEARSLDNEAGARKAGQYFLSRAVEEHRGSPWADRAALLLIEDGFCLDDNGYPDCAAWEVREYERWLRGYPLSSQRPRVLQLLAERYLALAGKFEEEKPWENAVRAEICRGRAMELAQALLDKHSKSEYSGWAEDFIRGIKSSGRPYSIIPEAALPGRE